MEDHTYNDECRMMGIRGDDEEDLGAEDLLGDSFVAQLEASGGVRGRGPRARGGACASSPAAPPLPAAAAAPAPAATGDPDGSPSVSTAATRRPGKRSKAWDEFNEVFEIRKGKKVRVSATCKHCGKGYSGLSTGGTGHLLRHIPKCPVLLAHNRKSSQSQLNFSSDGDMHLWEYKEEVARTQLCRLIARLDLPLSIGEAEAFEDYIRIAHNPKFSHVSRQTTTRDFAKYYLSRRDELVESFKSVSSVSLTSDIWSGNAKEDYLSVVAHYVNVDWQLEKRIIGMRLIDVSHNADNILDRISTVVAEFGLVDKIFAVTLDNAAANKKAIEKLTPLISGYVGSLCMHQRCACHIVNLIVKAGLEVFKPFLASFRSAISFVNASNQRIAAYKSYCISCNVRPRKFGLDMDVRWNATYLMLKHLLPHHHTFSIFIATNHPTVDGQPLLTDHHWYAAEKLLEFLEQFYDSTVVLSGVYYPTSPLVLHHVLDIAEHLNTFESDPDFEADFRRIVAPMKNKFLEYWSNIPMLYSFAFILDPRAKMQGFANVLTLLSQFNGKDYSKYQSDVRKELNELYGKYEAKFGSVRMQRPTQPGPTAGKKKTAWNKIFGSSASCSTTTVGSVATHGSLSGPSASSNLCSRTSASALLQAACSGASLLSATTELSSYLESDIATQFDDDFSVLAWWHEHKMTYPVLSILAKDVMTVPVSTVSSESAFSTTGRIIEERRRRLTSDMVEMLTLVKDWELADARLQHDIEDPELEEAFENLYLDD
ncbi:unnamed protein product [Urochloa humidicola]